MLVEVAIFRCSCGHEHESPFLPSGHYGWLGMRSERTGELVLLDAFNDGPFSEVLAITDGIRRLKQALPFQSAGAMHYAYGATCDRDAYGGMFRMGLLPSCPACGQTDVTNWSVPEPGRYVERALVEVTHVAWNALSRRAKQALVHAQVSEFMSMAYEVRRRRIL